jgi:hypothetical protein
VLIHALALQRPNPHSAFPNLALSSPAGSFLGGFRTPAPHSAWFIRRRRPEPFTENPSPEWTSSRESCPAGFRYSYGGGGATDPGATEPMRKLRNNAIRGVSALSSGATT